ncbi:MAG TPA: alkaline phosphatase family protein, partial [Thermoanaerobaculia bacterium]
AFLQTPFANDLVLDFARHVIDVEWMGRQDGAPDVLWVGLSATDYIGHAYGPDSQEVADAVVRLDRSLARFIALLESRFGDRIAIAITADHGTQAIPEVAVARGKKGGRIALTNPPVSAKTIGAMSAARRALEKRAAQKLGARLTDASPIEERLIQRITTPNFYLNWERIEALRLDPDRARAAVRDALFEIDGVAAAFTSGELAARTRPRSDVERAARASFRADRSGDVVAYLEPGYIYSGSATGSTHGQPVEADQHVLLMLWGAGIPKGIHTTRVETIQLARTLGALLGVDAGTPGGALLPGFQ